MSKPWFVVGGSGFIGTNLQHRRPCESYDLLEGNDARDLAKLTRMMNGYETVVHLAANADIAAGATDPNVDLDGITLTRNVCEAARTVGVKRIIYTSGSGVYGHRSADWPDERTLCIPVSPYGASKLASEAVLHTYGHMFGIEVVIFRPANVVGPYQTHGVGFDFMRRLREHPATLTIRGDGKQTKQYLHVDDLLDAFDTAQPGIWNVGPRDTLSVLDIAELACQALSLSGVFFDIEGGLAWPGDMPVVRLNTSALRMGGWTCRTSAEAMTQALAVL